VPIGLFGFHLPSEVMKKFRPSIWKIPERMNSEREPLVFLGSNRDQDVSFYCVVEREVETLLGHVSSFRIVVMFL
jgi:hypothetical protein